MENNSYVYAYLDPRKPGKYCYEECIFDYEPFYVGCGKNNRLLSHLKEAKGKGHNHKLNKIRKLTTMNLEPIIITIQTGMTDADAKNLEKRLISLIGRHDLKKGPLTNLTDGGDGVMGYTISEKTKKRWSTNRKGKGNPMYGKNHTSESRKQMSDKLKDGFKSGKIKPTEHTEEWKQALRKKYGAKDNLILKLNVEGLSNKEISKIVNLSAGAVSRRIRRHGFQSSKNKKISVDINKIHELVIQGLFYFQIAEIMNVSETIISKNYRKSEYYTGPRSKWDNARLGDTRKFT